MPMQDAWYYSSPEGERLGPVTYQEIRNVIQSGQIERDALVWSGHMTDWTPLDRIPELAGWVRQLPPLIPARTEGQGDQEIIESIKNFELVSAIVWGIIAAIQILAAFETSGFGFIMMIAGVWNIFAAVSRFDLVKKIQEHRKSVVAGFERVSPFVVIGLINLFFGAFFGALWVIFDFVIRAKVLRNRHLFDQ